MIVVYRGMDQLPADPVHRASHRRSGVWFWILVSWECTVKEGGTDVSWLAKSSTPS